MRNGEEAGVVVMEAAGTADMEVAMAAEEVGAVDMEVEEAGEAAMGAEAGGEVVMAAEEAGEEVEGEVGAEEGIITVDETLTCCYLIKASSHKTHICS